MGARPGNFVEDEAALEQSLHRAKLTTCPHCGRVGTLIGHGKLWGYAERAGQLVVRGRRFFCSDRFRRPGCGRTFSVLVEQVLRTFTVRAGTLLGFVDAVVGGATRKAAWERVASGALSLSSGYRLWRRLGEAQAHIRTKLLSVLPPPPSNARQPWAQLLLHLEVAVPVAPCRFARFQRHFQTHLLP